MKRFTPVEALQALLGFVTGGIGQPIRALHLQIGHSTVTSSLLVTGAIIFVGYYYTNMIYDLNFDRQQALVEQINQQRVQIELRSAKLRREGSAVTRPPWTMLAASIDAGGIKLNFSSNKIAKTLRVLWYNATMTETGIIEQTILGGQLVELSFPSATFRTAWKTDSRITLEATQVLSDGQEIKYTGRRGKTLVVPVVGS